MAIRETRRGPGRDRTRRTTARTRNRDGDLPAPDAEPDRKLAQGLGWFSIGLGLAEVVLPKTVASLAGIEERPLLLRLLGLREITSGLGIFAEEKPVAGLWSRVFGDAIDLSLLGLAFLAPTTKRGRLAAATAAVAGVTVLDVIASVSLTRREGVSGPIHVVKSIAINRLPGDCYAFFRDLENLPTFMKHLESVRETGERRSHWVACAPAGRTVEWDAEIVEDIPEEKISWRSVGGSVETSGEVRFERGPGERGTLMRVELDYSPPAGRLGAFVAKLFGEEPEQQLQSDLRRFKQVIETGEIPTTEGQPRGPGGLKDRAIRMIERIS